MKRKLLAFLALLFSSVFVSIFVGHEIRAVTSSDTVDSKGAIVYPGDPSRGLFGQNHNYSVTFRGNGEAVVSFKAILTNQSESDLSQISLRVPKADPKDIAVYQLIVERTCLKYKPAEYDPITKTYIAPEPPVCEQYSEPNFYSYYGGGKYQKASYEYKGDTLTVTLPEPIKPEGQGSYFVYFRAFGYAKKNILGNWDFSFETLKTDDKIQNLQVGIGVDSDLYIKGAKGNVNYRFEAPTMEMQSMGMAPAKSSAVDSFYTQIGQGLVSKQATNLSPLESYTVKGTYADSSFKLYLKEILIGLLIFVAVILILVMIVKFLVKKINVSPKEVISTPQREVSKNVFGVNTILTVGGLSFISALLITGYTILLIFLGRVMNSIIGYQYSTFFYLFLIVISFCIYALFLFGPALFVGAKKGIGWGIAALVFTIVWLFLIFVVAVFVIFLLFGGSSVPIPILEKTF